MNTTSFTHYRISRVIDIKVIKKRSVLTVGGLVIESLSHYHISKLSHYAKPSFSGALCKKFD
jgi:hypothetical protein